MEDLTIIETLDIQVKFDYTKWNKYNDSNIKASLAYKKFLSKTEKIIDENIIENISLRTKIFVASVNRENENLIKISKTTYNSHIKKNEGICPYDFIYFVLENKNDRSFSMLGGIEIEKFEEKSEIIDVEIKGKLTFSSYVILQKFLDQYKFYKKEKTHLSLNIEDIPIELNPSLSEEIITLIKSRIEFITTGESLYKSIYNTRGEKNELNISSLTRKFKFSPLYSPLEINSHQKGINCCKDCASFQYTLLFFVKNMKESGIFKWWLEKEHKTLIMRLKLNISSEKKIIDILQDNTHIQKLKLINDQHFISNTLNPLWPNYRDFPTVDLDVPQFWFNMDFTDSSIISTGKVIIEKGLLYLSYDKLRDYILPELFYQKWTDHFNDPNAYNVNIPTENWEKVIQAVQNFRKIIKDLYFYSDKSQDTDFVLPDIEDAHKDFPLCTFIADKRLREIGSIKFPQRKGLTAFLLDIGYSSDQIRNYMFHHYDKNVRNSNTTTPPETWKAEVSQWTKGKTLTVNNGVLPHGRGCARLMEDTGSASSNDMRDSFCCPYAHFDNILLEDFLKTVGITDNLRIQMILEKAKNLPYEACQIEMDTRSPHTNNITFPYVSPQAYFKKVRKRKAVQK